LLSGYGTSAYPWCGAAKACADWRQASTRQPQCDACFSHTAANLNGVPGETKISGSTTGWEPPPKAVQHLPKGSSRHAKPAVPASTKRIHDAYAWCTDQLWSQTRKAFQSFPAYAGLARARTSTYAIAWSSTWELHACTANARSFPATASSAYASRRIPAAILPSAPATRASS